MHEGEKGGECEEDILPIGGKPEEVTDLKKYHKMFQNLRSFFFDKRKR